MIEDITSQRWELLEKHVPRVQYDSQAAYRAMSAASMTDAAGNRLVRNIDSMFRTVTIASASGVPMLSLDLLASYPEGQKPRRRDRLKHGNDPLRAAAAMQRDPRYADHAYGRAVRTDKASYLQYWLWFYWQPREAEGVFTDREGAWRVVQIELDEHDNPVWIQTNVESRPWEPEAEAHPLIFVSPFQQKLYLTGGIKPRGLLSDGCDAGGPDATLALHRFGKWVEWCGVWGDPVTESGERRSPSGHPIWKKPSGRIPRSEPGGTAALIRRFPLLRPPGKPSLDARLERARVVVRYSLPGGRASTLYLTVHKDGQVIAAGVVQSPGRSGEHAIALPSAFDRCELRGSCTSSLNDRAIAEPVKLAANEPDALEATIMRTVVDEQLRARRIDDYAEISATEPDALRTGLGTALEDDERRRRMWRLAASDLQVFRDARTQLAREHVARRVLRASWSAAATVVVALAVLLGSGTLFVGSDPARTTLGTVGLMLWAIGFWVTFFVARGAYRRRSAAKTTLRDLDAAHGRAAHRQLEDSSLADSRAKLEAALRRKSVAPAMREYVNDLTRDRYGLRLAMGEEDDPDDRTREHEVPTPARTGLELLTQHMRGGSIGIAGPRGVGKTTLIEAFCQPLDTNDRRLTAVLAAPVQYDAREFVLTIFAELCARVLGSERSFAPVDLAQVEREHWTRRYRWLLAFTGFAWVTAGAAQFIPAGAVQDVVLVLAAGLGVFGVVATWWRARRRRRAASSAPLVDLERRLRARAEEALKEVRFQQSYSQGYSGKLTLPIGVEVGKEIRRDYSENQLSFPEVVDRLRRFIELAVAARGRVVIGIDEMDKMESAEVAQKFLNEIKAIFGVDGCFYLVSISESAMSSFQRRGLPFRDVFDSAFDEVLSVKSLTLSQSKALLRRRVVGLTPPFMALCHCLSGGLPRDHLRVMRQFAVLGQESRRRHVTLKVLGVCMKAVAAELSRKVEAAAVSAREIAVEPRVSDILFWLRSLESQTLTEDRLLMMSSVRPTGWPRVPDDDDEDSAALERLRVEVGGYAYYLATVLRLFSEIADKRGFEALEKGERNGTSAIDHLAAARVAFSVNARVAISMIDTFRSARRWPTREELEPAIQPPARELEAMGG